MCDLTEAERSHLDSLIDQELDGIDVARDAITEDRTITDPNKLLEMTAYLDERATLLRGAREKL